MSMPQKTLFSLLSLGQKFPQSVEIWQSYDKKISLHSFFWDTVYFCRIAKFGEDRPNLNRSRAKATFIHMEYFQYGGNSALSQRASHIAEYNPVNVCDM